MAAIPAKVEWAYLALIACSVFSLDNGSKQMEIVKIGYSDLICLALKSVVKLLWENVKAQNPSIHKCADDVLRGNLSVDV